MLAIYDNSNELTFDLLTLKVMSESRVTWATSVPILVFLGLSVLELGPIHDRHQTDRQTSDKSIAACALWGRRHNKFKTLNMLR